MDLCEGFLSKHILNCLPRHLFRELCRTAESLSAPAAHISEIRLRVGRPASMTVMGKNVTVNATVTESELYSVVLALCRGSLYAYENTVGLGYITIDGVRIGLAGRAVNGVERGVGMNAFSSLVIRIPHDVRGCADIAAEAFIEMGARRGILIYSIAGVGKTTMLRDLARTLSSPPSAMRVAIVDTRGEFSGCEGALVDILEGYSRGDGIELATRTLSPEVIICDELGDMDEARRIIATQGSGIPLVASCHAGTLAELVRRPQIKLMLEHGCFGAFVGISRSGECYEYKVESAEVMAVC